jgi:hypothetical protein
LPLTPLPLETVSTWLPPEVSRFIRAAVRRVERIQLRYRFPAFISSDFVLAYEALSYLESSALAPGDRFCEWLDSKPKSQ